MMGLNILLGLLLILVCYHHLIYLPWMIHQGRKLRLSEEALYQPACDNQNPDSFPYISVIIPAYNEAALIEQKLANLLIQDYPANRWQILIGCDGCLDETPVLAQQWKPKFEQANIHFEVHVWRDNEGKSARLNQLLAMAQQKSDLLVSSDVSALLSQDALRQGAQMMSNIEIGAITSHYLLADGTEGEQSYWQMQNHIRHAESELGSVMGCTGAFLMIRSPLFIPLPSDTINDDFMLPMQVLKQGYQIVLSPNINAVEINPNTPQQELTRRQRISAGNLQQLIRCNFLLNPKNSKLAWLFWSGKGLRTLMPFILCLIVLIATIQAIAGQLFAQALLTMGASVFLYACLPLAHIKAPKAKAIHYFVFGYLYALIGMMRFLLGQFRHGWRPPQELSQYQSRATLICKRSADIGIALLTLCLSAPIWCLVALLVKASSTGPIFYRQLRVGEISQSQAKLFYIIKFRSMYQDAEAQSGAVWAQKNDPRITPVGRFLRKTRLDELPQCLNVLRGEMSIVGPRPERPEFCRKLQNALPFYIERTAGLKPGITGLAQVNHGYDQDLDDVRQKLNWDHAYGAALSSPWNWLKMDLGILCKTIAIVILGRGQ
ncbi:hypothetical protein VST7929_02444 [Vibrio stylophorae]|uniref:Adhesion protein n=1 Tax=Vibrio stylophorae TaxID=659351 RepID=A0ABM8ZVY3_9VIBR|nr:sugar transferase [Vibrio stylophorae]CAH0534501.1 hypothetical protein VST7929_02444 [Vibrio stylophorae]